MSRRHRCYDWIPPSALIMSWKRQALLVGSLPFEDEEACMRRALDLLGPHLIALPDGEIGEKSRRFPYGDRIAWVVYAIERLTADSSNWRVLEDAIRGSDGMATDYTTFQKLVPLRTPAQIAASSSFGYDDWVRRSYPTFRRLRASAGLSLPFQLGVPTGSALGFAFSRPWDALRFIGAFNAVIAREVNAARVATGGDLIVQVEVPPEVFAAHALPAPFMGLALRPIHDLLRRLEPGARVGVHLCLGDFHNQALVHARTPERLVRFVNRLAASWPAQHQLEYVHVPLAEGERAPSLDPRWYEPLRAVQLSRGTRLVAGFVHEKLSLGDARRLVQVLDAAVGGAPVDIAASCGLGRRTPEAASMALEQMRELVAG
jgi:hypothetical protein